MTLQSKANNLAIALFLVLSCLTTHSQTKESSFRKVYGQLGFGPATNGGFVAQFGIQAAFKNNWSATFSYHDITMNPKNLPSDYQQGYTAIFILPIPDAYPEQQLKIYSITAGKLFPASRTSWLTTEAGLSIVSGNKFTFTHQAIEDGGIFGYTSSNYHTTQEKLNGFGGMLKADFTWAFCSFAGLGAGIFTNINSVQTVFGGDLKLIIGWMNRAPKSK